AVLLVWYERPDTNYFWIEPRRFESFPAELHRSQDHERRSVPGARSRWRGPARENRRGARPQCEAESESRNLRRARWRSAVDRVLQRDRSGLRELLAVPSPGRASRSGTG